MEIKYYYNNLCGVVALIETMIEHGVKKFVFSSTCATFGIPEKLPLVEDMPQHPINPYGSTKLMAERVMSDYGRHGIRTENLTVVVPFQETEFGRFCRFDTATLCPIDTKGILPGLLTEEEKDWLNGYHRRVYAELSPFLDGAEKEWLRENTQEI